MPNHEVIVVELEIPSGLSSIVSLWFSVIFEVFMVCPDLKFLFYIQ